MLCATTINKLVTSLFPILAANPISSSSLFKYSLLDAAILTVEYHVPHTNIDHDCLKLLLVMPDSKHMNRQLV